LPVTPPLVSIIIPTYNYATYLPKAVQSCLDQTHQPVEIIVVDDGSKDNTREVLKPFADRIRYFFQENRGVSAARNAGLQRSTGDFVTFLDADDYLLRDSIEARLEIFSNNPEVGIVASEVYSLYPEDGSLRHTSRFEKAVAPPKPHEAFLRKRIAFSTCTALIRGDLARRFKFPEEISNGEDIAYLAKVLFLTKAFFLRRPLAVMLRHADSQRHDIRKIKKQELALVEAIFDDPLFGGSLDHLRREFLSWRCLSISRSCFQSGDKGMTRKYYLKALQARPLNVFRLKYLSKFIRACL